MPVVFAERALAARLESFSAAENERFAISASKAHPEERAEAIWVAGGCAAVVSSCGPLNQVTGLGFTRPIMAGDIDEIERFFDDHGERVRVHVCPLADPSLVAELSRRGYVIDDFETVLVRVLLDSDVLPEPDPAIDIRVVEPDEYDFWGLQVVRGFSANDELTEADVRLGQTVGRQDDIIKLLALIDGEPAGTGELAIRDGVGWFSADTTLAPFRGRGIQTAMQRRRLQLAREAGCGLVVTESQPGSGSQRNMERHGFSIVYTRIYMVRSGG